VIDDDSGVIKVVDGASESTVAEAKHVVTKVVTEGTVVIVVCR
jgi:hypothetical protein